MIKYKLQFFGGRGSSGGKGGGGKAGGGKIISGPKPTADERNAQELARVQRENRNLGISAIKDLKKNETYDIQWGKNEVRQGKYVGGRMINGIAVQEFKQSNGKLIRIDNDDIKRTVRKRK